MSIGRETKQNRYCSHVRLMKGKKEGSTHPHFVEGMEAKREEITYTWFHGKQFDRTFCKLAVKQTAICVVWLPVAT